MFKLNLCFHSGRESVNNYILAAWPTSEGVLSGFYDWKPKISRFFFYLKYFLIFQSLEIMETWTTR